MAQHFLLSKAAKTLSLAQVFRMTDTEAEAMANLRETLELYFEDVPLGDVRPIEGVELRTLTLQGA